MKKKLKINLVNYEQGFVTFGILTKYANEMYKTLVDMGYTPTISNQPAKKADINHHINYLAYQDCPTANTLMITHLTGDRNQTEEQKIQKCKEALKNSHGICPTQKVMDKLIKAGCPKEKLSVILPAHDSTPRRPRFIAVMTKIYPDGRKRENMFKELFLSLKNPKDYIFRIIGDGWLPLLEELKPLGIQVQWTSNFDLDVYHQILNTSDYLLYTGDEDSLAQSTIDATQAGLRVIAPPSDDIKFWRTFETQEELNKIFADMNDNQVKDWTWENYVKNHLKIWEKLT